ncbi:MAG: phospholipid carrier-dependent glycosyltransferase [Acidobacteria bacterium]|nr:MAG: phospholipid carrier-dependent glycosyltransferase [Acidobacteriota bacterium]
MMGPKAQDAYRWETSLLALILAGAGAFRLAQLDGLAPFIDETAALVLTLDYQNWDVWSRLLHGKLLGYLWFKPVFLLAWDPLYAARLFSALTGVLSVLLLHRLLLPLVSRAAALLGAAFFAFMPLVVFHDRLALFDGFVVAGLTAALLFYLHRGNDRPLTLLATGFLFSAAVFTKGYALLAVLLWLPVLRRRSGSTSRALLIVGLGFLTCIVIMSVFLAVQLREGAQDLEGALRAPHEFLAPDLSAGQRASLALDQLGQIFVYLHGYGGWTLLPVILLAALLPGSRWKLRLELLAAWLLFSVFLSIAFRFLFSRYLLLSIPALALLVALAFDDCLEKLRTGARRAKNTWIPLTVFLLLAICGVEFVYRDTLIAAQTLDRVLPARDAYQYAWGGPSGFGLPEIADQLKKLDLTDDRKVICVTRGMGTGTHGAATLPLLLRHSPIRFLHLWLESEEDIQVVRDLPRSSRVVFLVDEPGFPNDRVFSRLEAQSKLLFEVKGTPGRPDYRLFELVR